MLTAAGLPSSEADAGEVVWRPSADHVARSRLRRFITRHGLRSVAELRERASRDVTWFWDAVTKDLGLEFYEPYERVVDLADGPEWARWYVGGKLNYVHNAVDKHARSGSRDKAAILWEGEEGQRRSLSYAELAGEVEAFAGALRRLGIGKGDRVGLFLPLTPEAAIASLACSKIGAIYTPLFSGFGASAVATRLQDSVATLLVTADGFFRRGAIVPMKETADEAVAQCPSIRHVLVHRRVGREVPWTAGRDLWWHDAVRAGEVWATTERTDAEDPFLIIYTSGTTGRPKGAVHVHGGFPTKGSQDMAHLFDVQTDDVLFWVTDLGWVVGPWAIIGALTLGATVCLYDGTPEFPDPARLWRIVERYGVTVFGIAPTAVRALMSRGEKWTAPHDLSSLRVLGSTGEPWNPQSWLWFFEHVGKRRCPIVNYSGGTEISGGILGGTTLEPLAPCAFTGPVPGMDADVVDEYGRSVRGAVGELVVRQPWPGMTRGFWRDRERYLETYWSRWPGTWVHGDWALVDDRGFWYVQGRSDDTLKIAGKRVGPAELESAAAAHPAVIEAAAIAVPDELKGSAPVIFAVLRPPYSAGGELGREIQDVVAHQLGRPFRPKAVEFVSALPKTRNAKIMRRVIRAAYLGIDPGDLSSLESLAAVEEIARLRP